MVESPSQLIRLKRDGHELSSEQIGSFIRGITDGSIEDYQATAFLMAVYFKGMTLGETVALTEAMLSSGVRYDLSKIPGPKADKHSTGGVGDKVSLILAPLAAACGLKVPMMSGRGLGFSGGTLDKLESIPGFNTALEQPQFEKILAGLGCAMIGQSKNIAPADKKLYALRDVTGTVECIPLITASILSKKIAEGTESLVLDVKFGSGAFMKSKESAKKLAKMLQVVAKKMGLNCRAVLTSMEQPLGYAVGNSLEVLEAIELLGGPTRTFAGLPSNCGSADLKELTVQLCSHMLELGGISKNLVAGRLLAHSRLSDGSAWRIFKEMVAAQGGDIQTILHPETLSVSNSVVTWKAKKKGFIAKMDTEVVGQILVEWGGGRKKASDVVNPSVGFIFHKKLGNAVKMGDPIATAFYPRESALEGLERTFLDSIEISSARKPVAKLIQEVLG